MSPLSVGQLRDRLAEGLGPSASVWPARVDGDSIRRADGVRVAVLQCEDLDVTTLDAERRAALVAALGHVCRTLRRPLQIVVRRRRFTPEHAREVLRIDGLANDAPEVAPALVSAALRRAEEEHLAATLREEAAYRSRVLVVCTADDEITPMLARTVGHLQAALAGGGVRTSRLAGSDLVTCLEESWTCAEAGDGGRVTWRLHPSFLMSGPLLLRAFRLTRLPGTSVEPGWLAPLLRLRAPADIGLHLHPVSPGEAMALLGRRLRNLRADQLLEIDREKLGDARLEAGMEAALDLRDRLARNAAQPLMLSLTAVARGRTREELEAASDVVRSAFAATQSGFEAAHLEHLDAAVSAWPLGDDRSPRRKLVDSVAASSCVPFVEASCEDPGGYPLGRASSSGVPVRLAPFDTRRHANANIAVLAASGRGKSYALGSIVLHGTARSVASVIVDPEGEYERLVRALGGQYLDLRPGCGSAFNVFECGDVGEAADADRGAEVVGAVVALVDILSGGALDDVERAHVDSAAQAALVRAAAESRVALLGDCVEALRSQAPRVATVLDRFCNGPLGSLFNRPTSIRLDAPVIGISLRDLREELVPAATLIVAEWLWALVRRDRRPRHLVFDEVGLLCAHLPLRTLLAQLARRCRKYGASLVIATQNAGDLLSTEEGRVMATNPAIVMLGGHRGAETARMEQAYALTPLQRASLEGAARGEFLLLAGHTRVTMRVEVPALHHALLTDAEPPRVAAGSGDGSGVAGVAQANLARVSGADDAHVPASSERIPDSSTTAQRRPAAR